MLRDRQQPAPTIPILLLRSQIVGRPLRNRHRPRWQCVDGGNAHRRAYCAGNEEGDEAAGSGRVRGVLTPRLAATVRNLVATNQTGGRAVRRNRRHRRGHCRRRRQSDRQERPAQMARDILSTQAGNWGGPVNQITDGRDGGRRCCLRTLSP